MNKNKQLGQHIDIVDSTSLFVSMKWISESLNINKIRVNYKQLSKYLDRIRENLNWPKSDKKLVICSVNPFSSFQKNFLKAIEEGGFTNIDIDYRSLFRGVSYNYNGPGNPLSSDVTHIVSYLLGKLEKNSSVTIVSGDFSLAYPLKELNKSNNCKTSLCFSKYLLDTRWGNVMKDNDSNINYFNMDTNISVLTDGRISLIKNSLKSSYKNSLECHDLNKSKNIFQGF